MYTPAIARPHVHTHSKEHSAEACANYGRHTALCASALHLSSKRLLACWWLLACQVDVRAVWSAVDLGGGSTSARCRRLPCVRRPLSDDEPHGLPGPGVLQETQWCGDAAAMLQRLVVPGC